MKQRGKSSIVFDDVYLTSYACVSGPLEMKGPLGEYIDAGYDKLNCNQNSWEKAEATLMKDAIELALLKGDYEKNDISIIMSGDLNNQIAITSYVMRDFAAPCIGLYGACSTSCLSLINGSVYIDNGFGKIAVCTTSSHNATSERQFRYPTEYGGQKPTSITFTATGAGAGIVSKEKKKAKIKVTRATIGQIIDAGVSDPLDMGRSMAPAAAMTFKQHLDDFHINANEYDLVITGDLSKYGSIVFEDILKEWGIDVSNRHFDAGCLLYNAKKQKVFAGGSGCACAALVMYGYLCHELAHKKLKKVLVLATGALHNPVMLAQNETIPCIAHAIVLEGVE